MLSNAGRYLFALAGFAMATFVGYGITVGDRSGSILLFTFGLGAFAAGLIVTVATISEPLPPQADAETPVERVAVDAGALVRPSVWPAAAAVALGVAGIGAAVNGKLMVLGLVLGLVPVAGWLGRVWGEHPSWSKRLTERLDERVLVPIALPVGMILVVGVIAISVSRVLLALPEKGSTAGALVIAVLVLFVLAAIAARLPRLRSSTLVGVAALAAAAVLTAGGVGAATGERKFEHKGPPGAPTFDVTAQNTKFSVKQIVVPAGAHKLRIVFKNRDAGTYHNVAIYTADGKPVFNGKPIPGGRANYDLVPPAPGTYQFLCDFHATIMKGDFVVK